STVRQTSVIRIASVARAIPIYLKVYALFARYGLVYGIDEIEPLQVLRYDGAVRGHYDWHEDTAVRSEVSRRRLSLVVQLSSADEYEGGNLDVEIDGRLIRTSKQQGSAVLFLSETRHRVTMVKRGTRYALVCWARAAHIPAIPAIVILR